MELTQEQRNALECTGKTHNLKFIILHGSYATGKTHGGSDVDIAVLGEKPILFDELMKIHGELADVFDDNLERELDLKTLHGADPLFRYHATRDSQLIYGDLTEFNEYKLYAVSDYEDTANLRELEEIMTRAKLLNIKKQLDYA